MFDPERLRAAAAGWTDEYLLVQLTKGPCGFSDRLAFDIVRAEVEKRGLVWTPPINEPRPSPDSGSKDHADTSLQPARKRPGSRAWLTTASGAAWTAVAALLTSVGGAAWWDWHSAPRLYPYWAYEYETQFNQLDDTLAYRTRTVWDLGQECSTTLAVGATDPLMANFSGPEAQLSMVFGLINDGRTAASDIRVNFIGSLFTDSLEFYSSPHVTAALDPVMWSSQGVSTRYLRIQALHPGMRALFRLTIQVDSTLGRTLAAGELGEITVSIPEARERLWQTYLPAEVSLIELLTFERAIDRERRAWSTEVSFHIPAFDEPQPELTEPRHFPVPAWPMCEREDRVLLVLKPPDSAHANYWYDGNTYTAYDEQRNVRERLIHALPTAQHDPDRWCAFRVRRP